MLLSPFTRQRLVGFISGENAADLRALAELVEAGCLRPAVDRTFRLHETAKAIRHLVDGQARGRVVVTA